MFVKSGNWFANFEGREGASKIFAKSVDIFYDGRFGFVMHLKFE